MGRRDGCTKLWSVFLEHMKSMYEASKSSPKGTGFRPTYCVAVLCKKCKETIWGSVVLPSKKSLRQDRLTHGCGGGFAMAGFMVGMKSWMIGFEKENPQKALRMVGHVIFTATTFGKGAYGIALPGSDLEIYETTPDEILGLLRVIGAIGSGKKDKGDFLMEFEFNRGCDKMSTITPRISKMRITDIKFLPPVRS